MKQNPNPQQVEDRIGMVLAILALLALLALWTSGCALLVTKNPKLDRVYWNGQWYDRAEYERIRK